MARLHAPGAPAGRVSRSHSVHDKDGWLGALRRFQALRREDGLPLRVWQSLPAAKLDEIAEEGFSSGLGDDYLRVGYIKAFMDGTLGSETARLLDGSGVEITSREELADIVRRAAAAGFPVAVHAIGDRANRDALDAFEETRDVWGPKGLRPESSMRSFWPGRTFPASPRSGSPPPSSSRTRPRIATSPTGSGSG